MLLAESAILGLHKDRPEAWRFWQYFHCWPWPALTSPSRHKVPTRSQRVAPGRRATIPGGHPAIPARQKSGFARAGACGRARRWTVWGVAWRSARAFPWQGDRFNRSRAERACVWHRPSKPPGREISLGHIEFDVGSKTRRLTAAGACATVMRAEPRWGADAQQIWQPIRDNICLMNQRRNWWGACT